MNERFSKIKYFVLFFLIFSFLLGGYLWKKRNSSNTTFQELQVARGDLQQTILSAGTVQPENRLEIKPPIPGRVEEVLVSEGQQVHKGQILAWMSSTERAALLDAARSKGNSELKKWQEYYRPTPVMAPISGTIILRSVEPGQTFTNNDSIFAISNRLTVKAQVDETDMAQIKLGLLADIILDAYPDIKTPGKVDHIAFEAKTVNNVTTYLVDVLPELIPDFMRSGMTANVTFHLGSKIGVLLVANEAIKYQGDKIIVLVPSLKGKPEEREIKTGLTNGNLTEVLSGLEEKDKVLVPQLISQGSDKDKGGGPFSSLRRASGKSKGSH